MKKLENLNGHYLREADDGRPRGPGRAQTARARDQALLAAAMPFLTPRAKDLNELAEGAAFLFAARPLDMDEKAAALLDDGARDLLARVAPGTLAESPNGAQARPSRRCGRLPRREGVKLGQVAQPLRAALTGRATSPGIFDVLVLLGREESLARVGRPVEREGRLRWRTRPSFR